MFISDKLFIASPANDQTVFPSELVMIQVGSVIVPRAAYQRW